MGPVCARVDLGPDGKGHIEVEVYPSVRKKLNVVVMLTMLGFLWRQVASHGVAFVRLAAGPTFQPL